MEAHQGKLDRYSLLAAMVERQVLDGRRAAAPLILPVVVSTHGELCPGTVQLQEWLVERYRARLRLEGERDDGEQEDELITAFRCELRAALLVATAKGTAEMLTVAGRPFSKSGAQRSGAWPGVCAPAAHAAGHSADDSTISDSGNIDRDNGRDSSSGRVSDCSSGSHSDSDNDSGSSSGTNHRNGTRDNPSDDEATRPGARAPAASAAGEHGADDSTTNDGSNHDSDRDDAADSGNDSDNATDSGSTDSDNSTTQARGGSGDSTHHRRRVCSSRAPAQPRAGTRQWLLAA
jgi:hypothetical protein